MFPLLTVFIHQLIVCFVTDCEAILLRAKELHSCLLKYFPRPGVLCGAPRCHACDSLIFRQVVQHFFQRFGRKPPPLPVPAFVVFLCIPAKSPSFPTIMISLPDAQFYNHAPSQGETFQSHLQCIFRASHYSLHINLQETVRISGISLQTIPEDQGDAQFIAGVMHAVTTSQSVYFRCWSPMGSASSFPGKRGWFRRRMSRRFDRIRMRVAIT